LSLFTLSYCAKEAVFQSVDKDQRLNALNTDRQLQMDELIAQALAGHKGNISLRTNYTITEAIDLLDETLNYNYCRPGAPLTETIILADTSFITLSNTNTVNSTDIATILSAASLRLGNHYHQLNLSNKQPWTFTVSQFDNPQGNQLPLLISLSVAYGNVLSTEPSIDPNANYSYKYKGGFCGDNFPGNPGAPELLRNKLKYQKIITFPNSQKYFYRGQNVTFCTPVGKAAKVCETVNGIPSVLKRGIEQRNEQVMMPLDNNNINDWYSFRQTNMFLLNYDECLTGDVEMPFNLIQMGSEIDNYKPLNTLIGNIWVGSGAFEYYNKYVFHNSLIEYFFYATTTTNATPLPCTDCGQNN